LRLWGNWGPQSPKQKKNASVWQAKINPVRNLCFKSLVDISNGVKAAKPLNHEPTCVAGGTQSSPKAMSAGDLKENKKPFFEATRKKRFVIFWWLCRIPKYLLPDKFT